MSLQPTPLLLENLYWITLIAVIVSSASGVLKAGFENQTVDVGLFVFSKPHTQKPKLEKPESQKPAKQKGE